MLCRWERANGYWHAVLMDRPPLFLLSACAKYASLAIRRRFAMIGNALTNRKTGRKRYCVSYEPWFEGWSISGSTDVSFLLDDAPRSLNETIFRRESLDRAFQLDIYIYIFLVKVMVQQNFIREFRYTWWMLIAQINNWQVVGTVVCYSCSLRWKVSTNTLKTGV